MNKKATIMVFAISIIVLVSIVSICNVNNKQQFNPPPTVVAPPIEMASSVEKESENTSAPTATSIPTEATTQTPAPTTTPEPTKTPVQTESPQTSTSNTTSTPQVIAPTISLELVKPSIVYGIMKRTENGFAKGTTVEVKQDKGNGDSYLVASNGYNGWVSGDAIEISDDPITNPNRMTKSEIESFVNGEGFSSPTDYFVWIDLDRQLLNIFMGSQGNWTLIKQFECATGKNVTPTIRGTFSVGNRGLSFGSYSSLGAKYFVQFSGAYLIHSVPFKNGVVADYTLGKRASHGCVRIAVENAKWVYDYIPTGTTVWSN